MAWAAALFFDRFDPARGGWVAPGGWLGRSQTEADREAAQHIWSQLGAREAQWATGALIFSAPQAVPRQLLANYAAGVSIAVVTGGLALHLIFLRDIAGLEAWAASALFIPALALALGVCSGSHKFFEALYTVWWYIGPMHHIRQIVRLGSG